MPEAIGRRGKGKYRHTPDKRIVTWSEARDRARKARMDTVIARRLRAEGWKPDPEHIGEGYMRHAHDLLPPKGVRAPSDLPPKVRRIRRVVRRRRVRRRRVVRRRVVRRRRVPRLMGR